jgi:preprotein translocase subunit SecG
MSWLFSVIRVVHILSCFFLIAVVLLQAGKGAGIGSAFGGASSAVFGGRGAGTFISKLTWIVAGLFMVTSVSLAWRSTQRGSDLLKKKSKPVTPEKLLLEQELETKDATGAAGKQAGTATGDATPQVGGGQPSQDATGRPTGTPATGDATGGQTGTPTESGTAPETTPTTDDQGTSTTGSETPRPMVPRPRVPRAMVPQPRVPRAMVPRARKTAPRAMQPAPRAMQPAPRAMQPAPRRRSAPSGRPARPASPEASK